MKTFVVYDTVTGDARIKCTVSNSQSLRDQVRTGEDVFEDPINLRTHKLDVSGDTPVPVLRD